MHDEYLRPIDAAKLLNISVSTLAKRRMLQQAPAFIKIGGSVRYERSALVEFMVENTKAPDARSDHS